MYARCHTIWYEKIYEDPDVAQVVDSYSSKILDSEDGHATKGDAEDSWNKWLLKDGLQLSPAQRYPAFLGVVYRESGLDKVRDMLNAHDPGYKCPRYPKRFQGIAIHHERGSKGRPFW